MLSPGIVEKGDAICVRPIVITHLCAMIQPSSQILFVSEQRDKDCCIYVSIQSLFIQNIQSVNFLWPSAGYLGDFQKELKKEKLHAYFILFTALNEELY